jgi:hypothetical protein
MQILRQIADGKLLLRFSYMSLNVTCDVCHSELKMEEEEQEDTLEHKPWCVVTAARTYFKNFKPSKYPHISKLRGYLDVNNKNIEEWQRSCLLEQNEKKADTEKKKRELIVRLLNVWVDNPDLNLGQLMTTVQGDLSLIEDFDLISCIEGFYI